MSQTKTRAIFITGTGTDVGKTVITAGIASLCVNSGLKTAVMKPVQTGATDSSLDLQIRMSFLAIPLPGSYGNRELLTTLEECEPATWS